KTWMAGPSPAMTRRVLDNKSLTTAVASKPRRTEFASRLEFARDPARSSHGWASPWAETRHGTPHADQASCPVVRAHAGGGAACGLRPAEGHRAIDLAGCQLAGVPG